MRVEDAVKAGFRAWKTNLIICVPFLLSYGFMGMILIALVMWIAGLVPIVTELKEFGDSALREAIPQLMDKLPLILLGVAISAIVLILISEFFSAGAIGMAKEALRGKATLAHMIDYGRRKFISVLFADLIVALIGLIGIIPLLASIPVFISNKLSGAILILVSFLFFILCIVAVSIVFALARYAVVVDDVGGWDGVRRGFSFFRSNKLGVLAMWVISVLFAAIVSLIGLPFPDAVQVGIGMLTSSVIVGPITTLWWTALYIPEITQA